MLLKNQTFCKYFAKIFGKKICVCFAHFRYLEIVAPREKLMLLGNREAGKAKISGDCGTREKLMFF